MNSGLSQNEPACHRAVGTHHERKLTHDDFRRAHYEFRDAHFNRRRSRHDGVMMFISRVPASVRLLEKHIQFGLYRFRE
jgi:hypothetical protein